MNTDPIKAKIQELCPDVMELKFGCELLLGDKLIYRVTSVSGDEGEWGNLMAVCQPYRDRFADTIHISNEEDYPFEILGSPITLAVVLRALKKGGNSIYYVKEDGEFCESDWEKPRELAVFWNLEHDNYDAQSQETKAFIGSLLNVV